MNRLILAACFLTLAAANTAAQSPGTNPLATARVFSFAETTAKTASNGAVGPSLFNGTLATGEAVAVHETTQPAGTVPNAAHRIQHSEVIVVEEGILEFEHDGKSERAAAGSVIYIALGTLHAVKNVGDGPARYVVVQIGGDTRK